MQLKISNDDDLIDKWIIDLPFLSRSSGHAPEDSKALNISGFPTRAEMRSGVNPSSFLLLILILFNDNKYWSTAMHLFCTAICKSVFRLLSIVVTSLLQTLIRYWTKGKLFFSTAIDRVVLPESFFSSTLFFAFLIKYSTASLWLKDAAIWIGKSLLQFFVVGSQFYSKSKRSIKLVFPEIAAQWSGEFLKPSTQS